MKGHPLTNIKKVSKEFEKRVRAVEIKSKLSFASCDLDDEQVLFLCQAIAMYPVITSLDLSGNSRLTQKVWYSDVLSPLSGILTRGWQTIEHMSDLLESQLLCAGTMTGEESLYCAGFLSKLALPDHLGSAPSIAKVLFQLFVEVEHDVSLTSLMTGINSAVVSSISSICGLPLVENTVSWGVL